MHIHQNTKNVMDRLSKVEGHIRGIKKMIEEEKSCDDILFQITAVQAALSNTAKLVLEDHYNYCVMKKVCDAALEKELIKFKNAVEKFIK